MPWKETSGQLTIAPVKAAISVKTATPRAISWVGAETPAEGITREPTLTKQQPEPKRATQSIRESNAVPEAEPQWNCHRHFVGSDRWDHVINYLTEGRGQLRASQVAQGWRACLPSKRCSFHFCSGYTRSHLQHENSSLQNVGASSQARDRTWAPWIRSTESYPLHHQGSPRRCSFDPLSQKDPLEEGNGNPLQYSCLGNPRDRGA